MRDAETNLSQRGNYLSRVGTNRDRRRFERRTCNFLGRILFTAQGTRGITQYVVQAIDISEGGVKIFTQFQKDIPRHFYFYVGKYQHGIGCAVVGRGTDLLRCEFLNEQKPELVDFLAKVTNAHQTLGELKHKLFGYKSPQ